VVGRVNAAGHSNMEGTRNLVRTARAGVGHRTALANTGSPRQATAPVGGIAQLPPTYRVVKCPAGVAHILLALSEGQFVNRVDYPYAVAGEVHRSPRNLVTDRVVAVGVVVGVGIGVVGDELQALREPLV